MPLTYCDVFSFLLRSVQSMGGCFFHCFRPRNHPHHHPKHEEVAEKIHLSSLFADEEREECVVKERENLVRRVNRADVTDGLLEEVKLLKACGTLPETPAEIRKAVKFSKQVEESGIKNPLSDLQSSPYTPATIRKEEILPQTSGAENSGGPHNAVESSPETPEEMQKAEFVFGASEQSEAQGTCFMFKASPYPTPRRITDDMQTPGTVYATNMKIVTKGTARIRSQYVYTVSNPIDNLSQLDDVSGEHYATNLTSDHEEESHLQMGEATPLPAKESSEKLIHDETWGDATLSSWLKPPPAATTRNPNVGKTPGERPIMGLVAAHWNEQEETPHMPPKWWDGNGIPNSTTKYKEDQKVCWHATPFEERLEKALSEETCVPQWKQVTGAPIIFQELEGQDTATSQLPTATKSVVSY